MSWSDKIFKILQLNFPEDSITLSDEIISEESVDSFASCREIIFNNEPTGLYWPGDASKEFWGLPADVTVDAGRSFAEEFIGALQFELNFKFNRWSTDGSVIHDTLSGDIIELQTLIIPTFL